MKGLNKIVLIAAIAAASSAQAELVAMDEASMGATTGQAGLTIEVNAANIEIGAIDYKDQGFLSIQGVQLAGADIGSNVDSTLDNFSLYIDVAGAAADDLGSAGGLGETYLTNAGATIVGSNEVPVVVDDGDLVISLRATDPSLGAQSVDFGLKIASVSLAGEGSTVGSIDASDTSGNTVLVSDLTLTGYIGPIDIIIDGQNGGLNINAYFNAAGTVTMPFIATSFEFAIHNSRGTNIVALGAAPEQTFAHAQLNVSQGTNAAGATALAFDLQDFSADMDFTDRKSVV